MGEALISNLSWRTPRFYREVGVILKEKGVISHSNFSYFAELVRIRNILVYNYVYISPEKGI